jgi:hypothetical protein
MPKGDYFSKEIDVRANWDVETSFDVSIPYSQNQKKTEKNKILEQ